jgi:hypothetical protein
LRQRRNTVIVSYKTPCPACKENGKDFRLQYEVGKTGVFCQNPDTTHTFTTLEEAESYSALSPAIEAPTQAAAPAPAPTSVLDPPPAAPAAKAAEPVKPEPVAEKKKPSKVVPRTVAAAIAKLSVAKPDPEESPVVLPGGAMLVTLRIEEQYVNQVKAEAEVQKISVQDHIQNIFTYGVEAGWWG